MPIYEFVCRVCGKVTEVMQKVSDAPLQKCPDCGGEVGKKMSITSFSLKGSGWYSTDYKKSTNPTTVTKPAEGESSKKTETTPTQPTPSTADKKKE